jgi:hypothetical protein
MSAGRARRFVQLPSEIAVDAMSEVAVVVLPPPALFAEHIALFRVDTLTASALAPDTSAPFAVSLTGRSFVALAVTALTTAVGAARAAASCGFVAHRTVRFGRVGIASPRWPRATMVDRDVRQACCRSALATIRFTGQASKAP